VLDLRPAGQPASDDVPLLSVRCSAGVQGTCTLIRRLRWRKESLVNARTT